MISSPIWLSRLPVGSSASRMRGWPTIARAMATRCCWPPESCDGKWWTRELRPTRSSAASASLRRSAAVERRYSSGISTLSSTERSAIRWNVWKMNPICRLRRRASRLSW